MSTRATLGRSKRKGNGSGGEADFLKVHETVLRQIRRGAAKAALGDQGSNDLLVSQALRTREMQVSFLSGHLIDVPVARAK